MSTSNLIAVPLDEKTTIYIEAANNDIDRSGSMFVNAASGAGGNVIKKAAEYFDDKMCQIKAFASSIAKSIESIDCKPDEFEVGFAVKFGAEAGVIISSVSSEANITIKLKWSKKKDE